jgi:hypothetical protein
METLGKKTVLFCILAFAVLASAFLAPTAQALNFNASDNLINYLIVSASPDTTKPGATVVVNVSGKLGANSSGIDIFHIQLFVDTVAGPGKIVAEGNLVLPNDGNAGTATYSAVIPSDAIDNTYLYLNMNDGNRSYARVSLSLIQNPTYTEIQSENQSLKSNNDTLTILLYIAVFVTVVFAVATAYILALTFKSKKNKKENAAVSGQP